MFQTIDVHLQQYKHCGVSVTSEKGPETGSGMYHFVVCMPVDLTSKILPC